jgi:hypothetical protein
MTDHAPISYTDADKRALRRSWSTCTARELDKLALSVERCIQKGAFVRESARFLRELIAELRARPKSQPRSEPQAAAPPPDTADVIAELRATGEASRRRSYL